MSQTPMVFALEGCESLGAAIVERLGTRLAEHELRIFEDGEHKLRPLESVRGSDVYVLQALTGERAGGVSVNDKLVRLLFFVATLRDAGAARVTLMAPYLAYARKDVRPKARDPVTMRYVAQLLESMGLDRVAALEVHNPAAFENAFRCPAVHLVADAAVAEAITPYAEGGSLAVVSPDTGGAKRAQRMREYLEERYGARASLAFLEKHRSEGVVSDEVVAGEPGPQERPPSAVEGDQRWGRVVAADRGADPNETWSDPARAEPPAVEIEERQLLERVHAPERRIERQAIDVDRRVSQVDVLGAQVAVGIHA